MKPPSLLRRKPEKLAWRLGKDLCSGAAQAFPGRPWAPEASPPPPPHTTCCALEAGVLLPGPRRPDHTVLPALLLQRPIPVARSVCSLARGHVHMRAGAALPTRPPGCVQWAISEAGPGGTSGLDTRSSVHMGFLGKELVRSAFSQGVFL